MRIAFVDDKPEEIRQLSEIISRKLNTAGFTDYKMQCYQSGEDFLAEWKPGIFDLIILDIFMGGISGVDVAHQIRKTDSDVPLVFCTTSNDFASESYDVNALFYLHKPYSEKRVEAMLSRLNLENYEFRRTITFPDGQLIIPRNILYTEYNNHVLTIYSKRRGTIRCYMSQRDAENILCEYPYFLTCSRGIIVNLYEVENKSTDTFYLTDGTAIPISRRKKKAVQEAYATFCFDKMRKEVFF